MASRLSIRWRLTLWYLLLLAAALALFAGGFYAGLRQLLYDALDDGLRDRAALVRATLLVEDGVLQPPSPGALPVAEDQFIRVSAPDGQVLATAQEDLDLLPPNPGGLAVARAGTDDLRWVAEDGDRLRVLSRPVLDDGHVVGVVEVGVESDIGDTLGTALLLIAVSAPLVLLVAAFGGGWLARRSLAPVDRMTRLAGEIGAGDLARRIDLALPDDELGRLALTFNAMLDRLEDAFTRQRRFTADAAHELRTPLTLLQAQIELALARPRDPGEDQAVLETLAGDIERLTRLSGALLALAQHDARGMTLHPEPVDLPALLGLVAEQYAPLAEESSVAIGVDAAPVTIVADEDRLVQVLVNLLDNALRYAPRGSGVTIGCRPEGHGARLWVSDAGPGIPADHLPRLFDRFYRVDPGRARGRGGIGLGLSICRAIVEAHGGKIAVLSPSDGGATVTAWLPAIPRSSEGGPSS